MGDLTSLSVEEIFQLLESNNPEIVCEIQRLFHENLSETKEGWLVSGLYDYYTTTGSANGLKLLLNVKVSNRLMLAPFIPLLFPRSPMIDSCVTAWLKG